MLILKTSWITAETRRINIACDADINTQDCMQL